MQSSKFQNFQGAKMGLGLGLGPKTIRSASASARNAEMQLRTQTDDAVALSLMSFECVTADEAWPRRPRILSCQWGGIKHQDMV